MPSLERDEKKTDTWLLGLLAGNLVAKSHLICQAQRWSSPGRSLPARVLTHHLSGGAAGAAIGLTGRLCIPIPRIERRDGFSHSALEKCNAMWLGCQIVTLDIGVSQRQRPFAFAAVGSCWTYICKCEAQTQPLTRYQGALNSLLDFLAFVYRHVTGSS